MAVSKDALRDAIMREIDNKGRVHSMDIDDALIQNELYFSALDELVFHTKVVDAVGNDQVIITFDTSRHAINFAALLEKILSENIIAF